MPPSQSEYLPPVSGALLAPVNGEPPLSEIKTISVFLSIFCFFKTSKIRPILSSKQLRLAKYNFVIRQP